MKANRWELATNRGWMAFTALLDANVLYPAPLRDLLLQLTTACSIHSQPSGDRWGNRLSFRVSSVPQNLHHHLAFWVLVKPLTRT